MKLGGYRESGNVVDRRGMGRGMRLGGLGLGGMFVIAVISMLLGVDPRGVLQGQSVDEPSAGIEDPSASAPVNDAGKQFVAKVLASTEDVWSKQVDGYREPKLVLFNGAVDSACGMGESAMGPFYCPRDHQVYLDLAFYRELSRRLEGALHRSYGVRASPHGQVPIDQLLTFDLGPWIELELRLQHFQPQWCDWL
jgi:predicted metalloprotease